MSSAASGRESPFAGLRRWLSVLLVLAVPVVLITALMVYGTHHWTPDCQTFWNSHYTGTQIIDGHRVECFHGNVVKVAR